MRIPRRVKAVAGKRIYCDLTPAIVSFSFDDAPLSAFTTGGKILEEHGFRGTYYVSAGLMGEMTTVGRVADWDTIAAFRARGHEIGNHTYDHLDCSKAGLFGTVSSIRRNRKDLAEVVSGSFAYPYGATDARARIAARLCTTSARGISFGINRGVIHLINLKAVRVYELDGLESCLSLVSECEDRGGWLIFYTHDVCDEPSEYGCTPDQFTRLVRVVKDTKLAVETVSRAREKVQG